MKVIRRRKKPAFAGHTEGSGWRKESAPPNWPFGVVAPRVIPIQPRFRKDTK